MRTLSFAHLTLMGEARLHPKKDENRHLRGRMWVRALLLISYGGSIMRNVVVGEGFRTPFCTEGTDSRAIDADVLGACVVREMIARCHRWNLPLKTIDCVMGSNVATPMHAVNPTRVAAVTGGLPPTIPADTVAGKNWGSGVTALYHSNPR